MSVSSSAEVVTLASLPLSGDVLEMYKTCGEDFTRAYLDCVNGVVDYNKRIVPLAYGSARSNSSGGSKMSLGGLRSPNRLVGSRLEGIRSIENWRSGQRGVAFTGRPLGTVQYPDGLCYGKMLSPGCAESVMLKVGESPTFGSLVRLSARKFKTLAELESFRLVDRGEGLKHVSVGGAAGQSLLSTVARYCRGVKVLPGSIGELVVKSGRSFDVPNVSGSDRVGSGGAFGFDVGDPCLSYSRLGCPYAFGSDWPMFASSSFRSQSRAGEVYGGDVELVGKAVVGDGEHVAYGVGRLGAELVAVYSFVEHGCWFVADCYRCVSDSFRLVADTSRHGYNPDVCGMSFHFGSYS